MMPSIPTQEKNNDSWLMMGYLILTIRFVQGFIYWGGGSRRFIYAPSKLDPHSTEWLANKMQAAMPGAILGTEQILSFLLQHFYILYPAIIIFSLVELITGFSLIFGFMTRFFGGISMLLSISLMLLFGWQGSTCVDEWTMAVSNTAMGLLLLISGSSVYSIDAWLLRKYPRLHYSSWFINFASGPHSIKIFKRSALFALLYIIFFTLSTYDYYRGAIISRYHTGPVSATAHHIALNKGSLFANGKIIFTAYVDSGTPADPSHILQMELKDSTGKVIANWQGKDLRPTQIVNEYPYNQFKTDQYGLVAPVGARAVITLQANVNLTPGVYELQMKTVNGMESVLKLSLGRTAV